MEDRIREIAKDLLESKRVEVVIGYGEGAVGNSTTPAFISKPEDVGKLIWNDRCYYNLVNYLMKPEVKAKGTPAIVVKGCDARSIIGLIAENQLKREEMVIIGVPCTGVINPDAEEGSNRYMSRCVGCEVLIPTIYDHLAGEKEGLKAPEGAGLDEETAKLDAMTPAERWEFWKTEFDRCIRCYACRQICPFCYCTTCICEKSTPQWISTSPTSVGNFSWNIIRAFHLAGRCTGCQECYRACPVNIRLDLLNRKLALDVKDAFGFEAGADPEEKPPLAAYKLDDNQDFIR